MSTDAISHLNHDLRLGSFDLVIQPERDDWLRLVPAESGVYAMLGSTVDYNDWLDRPIYIGGSINLRARCRAWLGGRRRPWPERVSHIALALCQAGEVADVESGLIAEYQPIRNVAGIELPYVSGPWR